MDMRILKLSGTAFLMTGLILVAPYCAGGGVPAHAPPEYVWGIGLVGLGALRLILGQAWKSPRLFH
jgi:hypothetical protein